MVGADVEELLGGLRALMSQIVDYVLTGGPRQEGSDDVGVSDIRQLVALLGEALDILTESLFELLLTIFQILGVPRAHVGALEVSHKDLLQVRPTLNLVGRKVL